MLIFLLPFCLSAVLSVLLIYIQCSRSSCVDICNYSISYKTGSVLKRSNTLERKLSTAEDISQWIDTLASEGLINCGSGYL